MAELKIGYSVILCLASLGDVLKYIKQATSNGPFDMGLPIYVSGEAGSIQSRGRCRFPAGSRRPARAPIVRLGKPGPPPNTGTTDGSVRTGNVHDPFRTSLTGFPENG